MATTFSKPVTEIIAQRFSCRNYSPTPIDAARQEQLARFIAMDPSGPFGSPTRFALMAATEADRRALRGLGTYGFIKNPTGFIIGAMGEADKNLEGFGYAMEHIILFATDLDLGTCWLGGSYTESRFAKAITATQAERVPAVTSTGHIAAEDHGINGQVRQRMGARNRRRIPWEQLFFHGAFDTPLTREDAGTYAVPLEMVRLGPSASNKQPWRIVKTGHTWHFYIQRTKRYGPDSLAFRLLHVDDMQRIDAGIAMCHFELTADELGLAGSWELETPSIQHPDDMTEYIASWKET